MAKRKKRRRLLDDPIIYDTNEQPFMLVDTRTHTNHAIRPGMQLWTVCGIQPETNALHGGYGPFKYKQKPTNEMNCLLCLSEVEF